MAQILIIEDESNIRQLVKEIVESIGHEATIAANGQEGIEAYRKDPVDLVITDIVMPEKDGVETIRELKHHHPNVKVIAITGYRGQYNRLPAAEYVGAQKTLVKPFAKSDLVDAVKQLLSD